MQQPSRQLLSCLASRTVSSEIVSRCIATSSLQALLCEGTARQERQFRTSIFLTAHNLHTFTRPADFGLATRHIGKQGIFHGFATKAEEYDLIVAEAGLVRIEGYDDTGFIVNDVQLQGAVFCIGDLTTMWKISSWDELTPESLQMLQLFKPAPDLVILGCGTHSRMVPPALQNWFRQHDIAYEAIDTANAVSTFNILNQEGRKVAGCLLPAGIE